MRQGIGKRLIFSGMVISLTVALSPPSYAFSPINSTQEGQIIKGGTYYNTSDSQTTFVNHASGDLWLQSGTTVRGLEMNSSGNLTNNGGNILLSAPGHVVRLDGDINVNGLLNGQGAFIGNGGKATVNATYLYQDGNIFARGANGGHVQYNVNSVTFAPTANVDASGGTNGQGGTIRVNATGVVNIQNGALMDTHGIPGVDSNVIEVIGGLVNNEGLISADGFAFNPNLDTSAAAAGTIRIVANGNINLNPVGKAINQAHVFSPEQKQAIFTSIHDLAVAYDARIRNTGGIRANGTALLAQSPNQVQGNGGAGGSVTLTAKRNILITTSGFIAALGGSGESAGNGGKIDLSSNQISQNNGFIQADGGGSSSNGQGRGGNGGSTTLKNLNNMNFIAARGGEGNFAGNGGNINLTGVSNSLTILANGGFSAFNHSGLGGTISMTDSINTQTGTISANGGVHIGGSPGVAGDGGVMLLTNITNNGIMSIDGGNGGPSSTTGGQGGRLTADGVINTGTISANGGTSNRLGGNGGNMNFTNLQNRVGGLISANGGNVIANPSNSTTGGNGGFIQSSHVFNQGLIQAEGGTGGTNGQEGVAIIFN